jgi:hypothetical protein
MLANRIDINNPVARGVSVDLANYGYMAAAQPELQIAALRTHGR